MRSPSFLNIYGCDMNTSSEYERILYFEGGEREHVKTNREKRQSPRYGSWWCDTCDRDYVSIGMKCSVCGKRQGGAKKVVLKKD